MQHGGEDGMPDAISLVLLDWLGRLIPYITTGAALVASYIIKAAGSKVTDITLTIETHDKRLTAIEANYVSKTDLENILRVLQSDLKSSFDRAHSRIDELYRVSPHNREH